MKDAILWKRILNEGLWVPENLPWLEHRIITSTIILSSIAFESNSNYFYDWKKFLGIAVPFKKSFWLEAPVTGEVLGPSGEKANSNKSDRIGCLISPIKYKDGWMIRLIQVSPVGRGYGATLAVMIGLDNDGNLKPGGDNIAFYEEQKFVEFPADVPEGDIYRSIADFALNALRIMSCRNISLESRDNDAKQVRRAEKRHGVQAHGYRYHVLVVRPPGAKHDSPGVEIGTMPRHVCRGHFAEYGPEFGKGLLFGKYAGRFFVPPHLKGKIENGEVVKDYAIAGK